MIEEYLTPEDYAVAKANGIRYAIAYARYYNYGWDKERTITEPVTKKSEGLWPRYRARAEAIGLTQGGFYSRLKKLGMTPEEAVTKPVIQDMAERSRKKYENNRIGPRR